jgi:hypothetical protein
MDEERRFAALLKPIRDLTENWDVDIAHLLEDYLEELEELRLPSSLTSLSLVSSSLPNTSETTRLEGQHSLNFAEAALLIQGSTAIYSKKVEYLHHLVFQALELITMTKGNKENGRGLNEGEGEKGKKVGNKMSLFSIFSHPCGNRIKVMERIKMMKIFMFGMMILLISFLMTL